MTPVNLRDLLPRRHVEWVLGGAALVFLAFAVWWLWPHPTPIPPKEQTTFDSLKATKPDYLVRHDTLIRIDSAALRQSRLNAARATEALRRADSLHALAIQAEARSRAATDSLTALASARLTITALVGETASLRTALTQKDSALTSQTQAHAAAEQRADEAERRLAATDDLSRRLALDLKASDKCRILYLLGCPSRKVSALAGLAVGAVAVVVVERR